MDNLGAREIYQTNSEARCYARDTAKVTLGRRFVDFQRRQFPSPSNSARLGAQLTPYSTDETPIDGKVSEFLLGNVTPKSETPSRDRSPWGRYLGGTTKPEGEGKGEESKNEGKGEESENEGKGDESENEGKSEESKNEGNDTGGQNSKLHGLP